MSHEKEPSIFGIDLNGKVWMVNGSSNAGGRVSWTPLPNPSRVEFKRLSALHDSSWGISCDHQIYVYLQRPDVPIRVREETYENQRWNPIGGFCDNLLPTDRYQFSNAEGTANRAKDLIKIPSEAWIWKGEWQIENTFGSEILEPEGWTYAVDFPATYSPEKGWKSCVRRRKWYRIREYIATNKWNAVPGVDEDFTKDPFIDVGASSYGSSHQDISCVWAVTVNGQVYHRKSVNRYNPEGSEWSHIAVTKGVQDAAQITVAANGTPFVVTWTGNILFRVGITPQNLAGTDWISVNGPPEGIFQLSAGKDSLWAISRDRKCWSLKGELQKIIAKKTLEPFEWMEIPGRMKAISVSKTDLVVLALSNEDNVVNTRFGVSADQLHGQGWKEAFSGIAWDAESVCSSVSESSQSSDQVDGGSQHGSSDECLSIRPDIPQGCPLGDSGDHSGGPVNLCWIDGGCVSSLKTAPEPDLEVGPWRDEILTGLQFRKCERSKFAYPNAVESSSSSWIKSMKARMFQHQKGTCWTKGELEVNNGDTLVFYKK
ncbi:unnamed protein product [Allacma fusca]|uniref:Peroxin/Ferlin domain-containing protein n=1 Tax=Allacma fusca TaxID=39272 RepID=A0A8J2LG22_9HEXA|nr:unnamed protein product [Allacma fusca]